MASTTIEERSETAPSASLVQDDPRIRALAIAIVALVDALVTRSSVPDELVPITREALAARHLEHRAIVRLVEEGRLRTVKIGRRRFTRASWLVDIADKTAVGITAPISAVQQTEASDLLALARKSAVRRAERAARRAGKGRTGGVT